MCFWHWCSRKFSLWPWRCFLISIWFIRKYSVSLNFTFQYSRDFRICSKHKETDKLLPDTIHSNVIASTNANIKYTCNQIMKISKIKDSSTNSKIVKTINQFSHLSHYQVLSCINLMQKFLLQAQAQAIAIVIVLAVLFKVKEHR